DDPRVEHGLQPGELRAVGEHPLGHGGAVDLTRLVEDPLAEPLDELALNLPVLAEQPVDDVVARDRRRTVPGERPERLALARADAARDGTRDRAGQATRGLPGAPRRPPRARDRAPTAGRRTRARPEGRRGRRPRTGRSRAVRARRRRSTAAPPRRPRPAS